MRKMRIGPTCFWETPTQGYYQALTGDFDGRSWGNNPRRIFTT